MKKLILIPARGGSKGIPDKNIKLFGDKPLIVHTLELARAILNDDDICVSTDSDKIINCLNDYNYTPPFKRPKKFATDRSSMDEVVMHAINFYYSKGIFYDMVILLQPTSPLRTEKQLKDCIKIFKKNSEALISVKHTKSNPYYTLMKENNKGNLEKFFKEKFIARQDLPSVWEINGAFYVFNSKKFLEKKSLLELRLEKFVMDELSSIDIDNDHDWKFAEYIYKNR